MQALTLTPSRVAPVRTVHRHLRARAVLVRAQRGGEAPKCSRREVALALVAAPALLLVTGAAQARDFKEAKKAAEARKEKLKEAADGMKEKGVTQSAFQDSKYAVSEEARTPNVHSRQEEGVKSQTNI